MNKKVYQQPSTKVMKILYSQMLCVSDPSTHDEVSTNPSYAGENRGWFDDEEEE